MDYVTSVELFMDLKPRICEVCTHTYVLTDISIVQTSDELSHTHTGSILSGLRD